MNPRFSYRRLRPRAPRAAAKRLAGQASVEFTLAAAAFVGAGLYFSQFSDAPTVVPWVHQALADAWLRLAQHLAQP